MVFDGVGLRRQMGAVVLCALLCSWAFNSALDRFRAELQTLPAVDLDADRAEIIKSLRSVGRVLEDWRQAEVSPSEFSGLRTVGLNESAVLIQQISISVAVESWNTELRKDSPWWRWGSVRRHLLFFLTTLVLLGWAIPRGWHRRSAAESATEATSMLVGAVLVAALVGTVGYVSGLGAGRFTVHSYYFFLFLCFALHRRAHRPTHLGAVGFAFLLFTHPDPLPFNSLLWTRSVARWLIDLVLHLAGPIGAVWTLGFFLRQAGLHDSLRIVPPANAGADAVPEAPDLGSLATDRPDEAERAGTPPNTG